MDTDDLNGEVGGTKPGQGWPHETGCAKGERVGECPEAAAWAHAEVQRRRGGLLGEAHCRAEGMPWGPGATEGKEGKEGAALPVEAVQALLDAAAVKFGREFREKVEKEMARMKVLRGLDARLAGGLAGAIYDEAIKGLEGLIGDAGGTPGPLPREEVEL